MSESADFDPGVWRGHDFNSARAHYDAHAGRSYDDAVKAGKTLSDLLEPSLKTTSKGPLLIRCDDTSSMGGWPNTIFSKLPYLELEGKEYLGEDMEISFGAFNDAYTPANYPLQVRSFTKGTDLKKRLQEIAIQGGGGGQYHESSELALLYDARNVSMPNAIHPIAIYITDEMPYDHVDPDQAKQIGVKLEGRLTTRSVVAQLQRKAAVYIVLKPYQETAGDDNAINRGIYEAWVDLVGTANVAPLPDPNRVVDVIFGILAKETGRIDYFKNELTGRQKPAQVATVLTALKTVHALPSSVVTAHGVGHSVMFRPGGEK